MSQGLVGEAETRRPILVIVIDPGVAVDAIAVGDLERDRSGVEVGDAVGDFDVGTIVLPAQPEIERELSVDPPVVGEVEAILPPALARPGECEVLFDQAGIAENEAGHGVSRSGD